MAGVTEKVCRISPWYDESIYPFFQIFQLYQTVMVSRTRLEMIIFAGQSLARTRRLRCWSIILRKPLPRSSTCLEQRRRKMSLLLVGGKRRQSFDWTMAGLTNRPPVFDSNPGAPFQPTFSLPLVPAVGQALGTKLFQSSSQKIAIFLP